MKKLTSDRPFGVLQTKSLLALIVAAYLTMAAAVPPKFDATDTAPTTASPATVATAAPTAGAEEEPQVTPAPTQALLPAPTASPASEVPTSSALFRETALTPEQKKELMRQAIPEGGAEMGQRSPRVLKEKGKATGAGSVGPGSAGRAVPRILAMATDPNHWRPSIGIAGQDVSGHQGIVDWQAQWNHGSRWAYVKASEGNYYLNERYSQQYNGSRNVGMVRGAYHFAIPNWSSGADQARYFVANGGGWSADGWTLPPVLDIEYNPYEGRTDLPGYTPGNTCYDLTHAQMRSWISEFGNTVKSLTGRFPVIYSTTDWWTRCTGNASGFGDYPLWIAAYPYSPSNSPGTLPASWSSFSMWQYSSTGPFAGDSNIWNGDYAGLKRFASYSGSNAFLKGPDSSTVYLVNGQNKYPVPDWDTYQLYARVGSLGIVNQQFLDSLATGGAVGRFARSSAGAIYLFDEGSKFHVPSCAVMDDFGGRNCTGWVPLADNQLENYSNGGTLTQATVSPTGRQFFISAKTKREFYDSASLNQAGFPAAITPLSDALTAGMPYAAEAPVVRPDVIIVDRVTRQPYLHTLGNLLSIPESVNAENLWTRHLMVAALDPQSIAKMVKGRDFSGYAANISGTDRYLVGSSQKYRIADPAQWPQPPVVFSEALLQSIGTGPDITDISFLKSSTSPVVYRRTITNAREIPDLGTLIQLGLGQIPPIHTLSATTLGALPKGAALLPLAKLAVGDADPAVYLIDGTDKALQLEDFRISDSLGIKGFARVPQASIAPYTTTGKVVPAVRCGTTTYIGYRGALWRLPASSATAQLPAQALEASTCLALPGISGEINSTVFAKALDSPHVYVMADGGKRPVASWERLTELNGGNSSPVIAEYSRSVMDAIPTGTPA